MSVEELAVESEVGGEVLVRDAEVEDAREDWEDADEDEDGPWVGEV